MELNFPSRPYHSIHSIVHLYTQMKKHTINYHDKRFKALSNSENGEVGSNTIFHYRQEGNVIWATYKGDQIKMGTLTGIILPSGNLQFNYQHVNVEDVIMTGICQSAPELNEEKKVILHETWQWTSGDRSKGTSQIIEI